MWLYQEKSSKACRYIGHLLWQSSIVSVSTAEFCPNKTMGPNKTMDIGWEEIMQ
jgi:hypothetical protein